MRSRALRRHTRSAISSGVMSTTVRARHRPRAGVVRGRGGGWQHGGMAAELRVGCAMWAHKAWQGRFLPDGMRRAEQLPAYATWCTAVEGNTTAYGLPSPTTVAAWAEETPPDF